MGREEGGGFRMGNTCILIKQFSIKEKKINKLGISGFKKKIKFKKEKDTTTKTTKKTKKTKKTPPTVCLCAPY